MSARIGSSASCSASVLSGSWEDTINAASSVIPMYTPMVNTRMSHPPDINMSSPPRHLVPSSLAARRDHSQVAAISLSFTSLLHHAQKKVRHPPDLVFAQHCIVFARQSQLNVPPV